MNKIIASDLFDHNEGRQIQAVQAVCRNKQAELLPELLELLESDSIGYFVQESLPAFGTALLVPLRSFLDSAERSLQARVRAAGVLAYFGDSSGVPLLLEAIHSPQVNQLYFTLLQRLAPDALAEHTIAILSSQLTDIMHTTEHYRAEYFSKLVSVVEATHNQSRLLTELEQLLDASQHWLVQASAALALYHFDRQTYQARIEQVADQQGKPLLRRVLSRAQ